jgi:hypothetical protein
MMRGKMISENVLIKNSCIGNSCRECENLINGRIKENS